MVLRPTTRDESELAASSGRLTSDLPSRNGRKRGKRKIRYVPIFLVLVAGVLGFLIPTLQKPETVIDKSVSFGQDIESDNNREPEEPVYVTKEFAIVKTNEVGFLNVRADASTSATKLGTLDIADKSEVLEEQGDWVKIKLAKALSGKTEGWVALEYVDLVSEKVRTE